MQILIIRSGVEFTQGVSECNSHSRGRVEMVVLRVYSRCCRGRKLLRFLNIHPYALPLFLRGAVAYAARTTLDCVKYEHAPDDCVFSSLFGHHFFVEHSKHQTFTDSSLQPSRVISGMYVAHHTLRTSACIVWPRAAC